MQSAQVARHALRPCIDLHDGRVKQIVGSTLQDDRGTTLRTNFSSTLPPS